ncbi:hypothetical protein U1Q18_017419 [Sarracenia purpurea var. burkii]
MFNKMRSSAQPQGSSQAQSAAPFGQGSHAPSVIPAAPVPASATPAAPTPQVQVPQAEGHATSAPADQVARPAAVQAESSTSKAKKQASTQDKGSS